jgi:hypothetical protein
MFIEGRGVAAVTYAELEMAASATRFIEEAGVPSDAQTVGHTWRFVNKNGSPDKRFNNDRRLPIAQYEELRMTTASGVNELFNFSRLGVSSQFVAKVRALASFSAAAQ